ncbi:MAG TPA: protein kinase [Kofleriaceae bacterium]|jgi:predicted Ser/Thr protein kinase|nr:protein kinase [Kofleriaceae bacterium]
MAPAPFDEACPADEDIAALVHGNIEASRRSVLEAHVAECATCRRLLSALARAAGPEPPVADDSMAPTLPLGSGMCDTEFPPGARFGRYVVLDWLGAGGMGVVYSAHDPDLNRKVALKVLRNDGDDRLPFRDLLLAEAQAMAQLAHPNVVTVFEVGSVDDRVFLAMELIEGQTLAGWLRASRRKPGEILAMFVAAGRGLAAAHAAGLIHRDFKPDNVLVGNDGRVCVTDFGLARPAPLSTDSAPRDPSDPAAARAPQTGLAGTLAYMAPEQYLGRSVDARADQFSFAVGLYEALYGERPSASPPVSGDPPAVTTPLLRGVPVALRQTLLRALRRDPDERYPSITELLAALTPPPRRARHLAVAAIASLVGAALALAATAAVVRALGAPREPRAVVRAVHRLTFPRDSRGSRGCAGMPSFATDGRTLVYDDEAPDGDTQLYALDLASGSSRQLTWLPGINRYAEVSPDGRRVAYVHDEDGLRHLRVLPVADRGAPRTIGLMPKGGKVMWLSAAVVAAADAQGNITGWDIDDTAAPPQVIHLLHDRRLSMVSAFRDGGLAIDWVEVEGEARLGIGVLERGRLRVLADHVAPAGGDVVAAPSKQAVYFTTRHGAVDDLMRAPRAGGELQTVGGGVVPSYGFSISADGRQLAFSTCKHNSRLLRLEDDGPPVPVMPSGDWYDDDPFTVDDRHLLFSSNRTGSVQLFVRDSGNGEVHAVGPEGGGQLGGVSQDRRWFVYAGRAPAGIWLGSIDGATPPRRLTDDASDAQPTFSHDDRHVIFERRTGDDLHLWIVPAAGGAARQLVATPSRVPMTSAVDDRIFFVEYSELGVRLMVTDEHGGAAAAAAPPMLTRSEGNTWGHVRSRDGRRILMVRGGYEIVEVDVDSDRPPRTKHRLHQWILAVNYAADDQHVIASVIRGEGDLWLAEGEFP